MTNQSDTPGPAAGLTSHASVNVMLACLTPSRSSSRALPATLNGGSIASLLEALDSLVAVD